jgi:NAD(P)-dependent dehydrogenase (short-subunit alcohol dehydrogenase family)
MTKRALVTGATSSIGLVLAPELSKNGYEFVLHFNENEDVLASSFPGQPRLGGDFSTGEGMTVFVDAALGAAPFDVMVNVAALQGRVDERSSESWQRVFNINPLAPALLMAHAADLLRVPRRDRSEAARAQLVAGSVDRAAHRSPGGGGPDDADHRERRLRRRGRRTRRRHQPQVDLAESHRSAYDTAGWSRCSPSVHLRARERCGSRAC